MLSTLISASLLFQAASEDALPFCGSREREIGAGFELTQYMFDGARDFSLTYRPKEGAVVTNGVSETAPFRLMFARMHLADEPNQSGLAGAHVGFNGYRFVHEEGLAMGIGALRLECGEGVVLTATYGTNRRAADAVPITFHLPFLNQPEQQCIHALRDDGWFRFTAAEDDASPAYVVIEDSLDLSWAVEEADRIWRAELTREDDGLCRMMPPPPPRLIPAPPQPPSVEN